MVGDEEKVVIYPNKQFFSRNFVFFGGFGLLMLYLVFFVPRFRADMSAQFGAFAGAFLVLNIIGGLAFSYLGLYCLYIELVHPPVFILDAEGMIVGISKKVPWSEITRVVDSDYSYSIKNQVTRQRYVFIHVRDFDRYRSPFENRMRGMNRFLIDTIIAPFVESWVGKALPDAFFDENVIRASSESIPVDELVDGLRTFGIKVEKPTIPVRPRGGER